MIDLFWKICYLMDAVMKAHDNYFVTVLIAFRCYLKNAEL